MKLRRALPTWIRRLFCRQRFNFSVAKVEEAWHLLCYCYPHKRRRNLCQSTLQAKGSLSQAGFSGGGVVPSKRFTKPSNNLSCPAQPLAKKIFSRVGRKIIKIQPFTTEWLKVKPKISQGSPGNIFALANCVLQKPTRIQIDWFWNQSSPIFVSNVCNYMLAKYICQNVRITSGRGRGRFY